MTQPIDVDLSPFNVVGNDEANVLVDTDAAFQVFGYGGNDLIIATVGPGNAVGPYGYPVPMQYFFGGLGNDTMTFTQANTGVLVDLLNEAAWRRTGPGVTFDPMYLNSIENIHGTSLNDIIRGDGANNTLWGGSGHDQLEGGDGNDTLYGGSGADTIYGGNHTDYLYGGDHNDSLHGGDGNDFLYGDAGNDTLYGDAGTDTAVFTTNGNVQVNLGLGIASGALGNDLLSSIENVVTGSGHDVIVGNSGANRLEGGNGNDVISGGSGNDVLLGGDGNDTINGGNHNDTVEGGNGHDTVNGDSGNDTIRGGAGNDVLRGGSGNDVIHADGNADTVRWNVGDLGMDTIHGFTLGTDKVQFGAGFLVDADPADSLLVFSSGADSLLFAQIVGEGYEAIALFKGIAQEALEAAIDNGVLFGYQAGFDGPGGVIG